MVPLRAPIATCYFYSSRRCGVVTQWLYILVQRATDRGSKEREEGLNKMEFHRHVFKTVVYNGSSPKPLPQLKTQ